MNWLEQLRTEQPAAYDRAIALSRIVNDDKQRNEVRALACVHLNEFMSAYLAMKGVELLRLRRSEPPKPLYKWVNGARVRVKT